jgi:hypothetical protein
MNAMTGTLRVRLLTLRWRQPKRPCPWRIRSRHGTGVEVAYACEASSEVSGGPDEGPPVGTESRNARHRACEHPHILGIDDEGFR